MNLQSPKTMREEHDELHRRLAEITKIQGPVGEAGKKVAAVLHNHFLEEEKFAIPPLGLLPDLAKDKLTPDMSAAITMSETLEKNLPKMLREHEEIVAALNELIEAAQSANMPEYAKLARDIIAHAKNEEEIVYPASILIGKYLKIKFEKN